jgi:hypothetical protein
LALTVRASAAEAVKATTARIPMAQEAFATTRMKFFPFRLDHGPSKTCVVVFFTIRVVERPPVTNINSQWPVPRNFRDRVSAGAARTMILEVGADRRKATCSTHALKRESHSMTSHHDLVTPHHAIVQASTTE